MELRFRLQSNVGSWQTLVHKTAGGNVILTNFYSTGANVSDQDTSIAIYGEIDTHSADAPSTEPGGSVGIASLGIGYSC